MTLTLSAHPMTPTTTVTYAARAAGATKRYGTGDSSVTALDTVTVEFRAHEFTAIMGKMNS
jgi:putative ABC transport system ATP-binding protein